MPGLVDAEEVACPSDLEVAHGDLEPGSELGVLADRPEALVGLLGQDAVGGVEEVGVGALAAPAHPAADLVELPQAEQVGAVDHERVDRRHVDPRLDDRRAHEDVELAVPEVEHDLLEAPLVHLAVGDRDPRLGHEVAQPTRHRLDVRTRLWT